MMSVLSHEEWGDIVDFPLFAPAIWMCYKDAQWLVSVMRAKYELAIQDFNGCLDSGLL